MMLPDYVFIAEIFLYSVGYNNARNVARKLCTALKISSGQLSS